VPRRKQSAINGLKLLGLVRVAVVVRGGRGIHLLFRRHFLDAAVVHDWGVERKSINECSLWTEHAVES
jgi:hypothetical protein